MSPGSCSIEAYDTRQGVIEASCEGQCKHRLNGPNDNLPAYALPFTLPPNWLTYDDSLL